MSNFVKINIGKAKKDWFLAYFNEIVNTHSKLSELIVKSGFTNVVFKNWELLLCNSSKCVKYASENKINRLDKFIMDSIIFDVIVQYYSQVSGNWMKYDSKLLDYAYSKLNTGKTILETTDSIVSLNKNFWFWSINLYFKDSHFHNFLIDIEVWSEEHKKLSSWVAGLIKKLITEKVKDKVNTKPLILKSDNALFLWCSCVWWHNEHSILFSKYSFDWKDYLSIKPHFNMEFEIAPGRIYDDILLDLSQISELWAFLKIKN